MAAGEELVLEPYDSPHHPMASWFADMRRRRAEHYERASRAPRRRRSRAMVTIVNNEPVFLPIWLAYYSRFFAPEDIYVLDNESTDDAIERGGFVRIPAAHDRVDHRWMVSAVQDLQHELLERYDIVVFTDVDELIAPAPQRGTLGDYLDDFDEDWVNCLGYEILHVQDDEPPLQLDRPILDQRGHWFYNDGYDKAAIATVPLAWHPGFHGRSDFHFNLDPDLRLIHLHRVDYDICLERHRARSTRRWAEVDADKGWAAHNLITEEAEFRRWFYEDSSFANLEIQLEPIGPRWRGVF
jgi:Glycosyltransferase family 92